jgi:hypothetical protein
VLLTVLVRSVDALKRGARRPGPTDSEVTELPLFSARRADIECYARSLEERGLARATVARRLCTVAGFYRYAEEEGLITVSPAVHVRRPRLDYESHAVGLDRNEVGALLVAAGLGPAIEHALTSLLALNGLRVSEATGANIESLGLERGLRTFTVLRKGGKVITIPLAPRTARAVDLAIEERACGPIFITVDGHRLDRHGAARIVRKVARRAGLSKRIGPHTPRLHHRRTERRRPSRYRTLTRQPNEMRSRSGAPDRCHTLRPDWRAVNRPGDDPVPANLVLNLDEAFRVLEALEDARLALRDSGLVPGLQDEVATVIRIIHGRLGLEEGGVL